MANKKAARNFHGGRYATRKRDRETGERGSGQPEGGKENANGGRGEGETCERKREGKSGEQGEEGERASETKKKNP